MSRKELKKVHIDDKEYVYAIRKSYTLNEKDYTNNSQVNVYESGDKSKPFCELYFPGYTAITPSMVKEGILKYIASEQY